MSPTLKLVLVLLGLAYLISPADLIPDLLVPWVGWIDDSLIIWTIYYLIRHGELPWFLFKKKTGKTILGKPAGSGQRSSGPKSDQTSRRNNKKTSGRDAPGNNTGGQTPKPRSAHEILGVAPDASWPRIQAAYKEKIKQYHPDKLSHLGEEFSTLANKKFLEIQAAYGELKQKRRPEK